MIEVAIASALSLNWHLSIHLLRENSAPLIMSPPACKPRGWNLCVPGSTSWHPPCKLLLEGAREGDWSCHEIRHQAEILFPCRLQGLLEISGVCQNWGQDLHTGNCFSDQAKQLVYTMDILLTLFRTLNSSQRRKQNRTSSTYQYSQEYPERSLIPSSLAGSTQKQSKWSLRSSFKHWLLYRVSSLQHGPSAFSLGQLAGTF